LVVSGVACLAARIIAPNRAFVYVRAALVSVKLAANNLPAVVVSVDDTTVVAT
jgi:hypothetical protein